MIPLSYIIALVPIYILIYVPLSNIIFGVTPQNRTYGSHGDAADLFLNSSFIATEDTGVFDPSVVCPVHQGYDTHILSWEPLVVYVENFLSVVERQHLVAISQDKFQPSTVSTGANTTIDKSVRHSEVALLDRDDTVRCIEHRARGFQGWSPNLYVERLRTQRYGIGGHYGYHFDWSGASREQDRVSTFMVYVDTKDCVGGGTRFPRLRARREGRWCDFLECDDGEGKDAEMGLTFKPIAGNAVYWVNIDRNGRGYEETWHAGLPVESGEKIGLNIWSWGSARQL